MLFRKGKGVEVRLHPERDQAHRSLVRNKKEARQAAKARKEELTRPECSRPSTTETPTDMAFLELVNRRLDHVKVYNSERHYTDHLYLARKWVKEWRRALNAPRSNRGLIESFLMKRVQVRPRRLPPTRICATCVPCSTSACTRSEELDRFEPDTWHSVFPGGQDASSMFRPGKMCFGSSWLPILTFRTISGPLR